MAEKPELVVFSQNKIGGVQSFYHQLLSHDAGDDFDKLWIFTDFEKSQDARLPGPFNCCEEKWFVYSGGPLFKVADRLQKFISNRSGLVIMNHELELVTLHRYRRTNKTVVFICHDEMYLGNATKYEFLIDVFIAHNIHFFRELGRVLPPGRANHVYYLPYGIAPSIKIRTANSEGKLRLLFVARLTEKKGIFDLRKIDDKLIENGILVEWTIIGDGPAKDKLQADLAHKNNFSFASPPTRDQVLEIASQHDVFVLPSYLDGVPVALLESMSAGLVPVIYQFNEGIDEIVRPENGFLIPTGDVVSFANAIVQLHQDRIDLEQRGNAARKKILQDFEVNTRAKNYYELFGQYQILKRPMTFRRRAINNAWDYPWVPLIIRKLYRLIFA